jgi:hypothetical protein
MNNSGKENGGVCVCVCVCVAGVHSPVMQAEMEGAKVTLEVKARLGSHFFPG